MTRKTRGWPKGWKLPKGAAALIFFPDGAITAQIPKAKEYAPESAGMLACLCMIVTSEKMLAWRTKFIEEQFRALDDGVKPKRKGGKKP